MRATLRLLMGSMLIVAAFAWPSAGGAATKAAASVQFFCAGIAHPAGAQATCTVEVVTAARGSSYIPNGVVKFSSGTGKFSPTFCLLQAGTELDGTCSTTYRPNIAYTPKARTDSITAAYQGDAETLAKSTTSKVSVALPYPKPTLTAGCADGGLTVPQGEPSNCEVVAAVGGGEPAPSGAWSIKSAPQGTATVQACGSDCGTLTYTPNASLQPRTDTVNLIEAADAKYPAYGYALKLKTVPIPTLTTITCSEDIPYVYRGTAHCSVDVSNASSGTVSLSIKGGLDDAGHSVGGYKFGKLSRTSCSAVTGCDFTFTSTVTPDTTEGPNTVLGEARVIATYHATAPYLGSTSGPVPIDTGRHFIDNMYSPCDPIWGATVPYGTFSCSVYSGETRPSGDIELRAGTLTFTHPANSADTPQGGTGNIFGKSCTFGIHPDAAGYLVCSAQYQMNYPRPNRCDTILAHWTGDWDTWAEDITMPACS